MRNELGGDTHFTSFACKNKKEKFCLKRDESAPKSDHFIHGERYRIETDVETDDDETDNDESGDDEACDDDEAETDLQVCKFQI